MPRSERVSSWLAALCLSLAGVVANAAPPAVPANLDYRLVARALADGVYVVEGANADFSPANGCNIINTGFLVTDEGVLVVNTGPSRRYGEQLRALIARTTDRPVRQVVHLNLHPDYFLGNQAFADVPRFATPATLEGMRAEFKGYEDNLYRVCGDWMKGTEALLPDRVIDVAAPSQSSAALIGHGRFALKELRGHTASDLVLTDTASGVAFAGGLVFADRVPTTPHAELTAWQASLKAIAATNPKRLVPSHGPVDRGVPGIAQTQRYLQWLDRSFTDAAAQGQELIEVISQPVPTDFRAWAAFTSEYPRNVAHLYPAYELRALQAR